MALSHTAAVILQSFMMATSLLAPFGARADQVRPFNIAAQPLESALLEFSKQSDQQIVGASDAIDGKWTSGVRGRLGTKEALEHLLSGTGLTFAAVDQGTIRIYARPAGTAASGPSRQSTDKAEDEYRFAKGSSLAASSAPAESADKASLAAVKVEEVLVTAQKKSQRLADVPVPVTVLEGEVLAERNEIRLQDYFADVPGLTLTHVGPGMQSLSLRGVTVGVIGNPTVGVMIDDMPYGSSTLLGFGAVVLPDLDPNDLARVEVLRGPQGTLYGASSLGGLLKFVTRDPSTQEFSGRVEALGSWVDNGDRDTGYGFHAVMNVPLSDTAAMRVSGFTRRDPGYIENVKTGENAVNPTDVYGGRVSVLWQPTDTFSLKVDAMAQKTEGDGSQAVDADASLAPIYGDLTQARQVKEGYETTVRYFTGTLHAQLGDLELASLSAYGKNDFSNRSDETPAFTKASQVFFGVEGARGGNDHDVTKFSQELRLSSAPGQKYEWLLGAFYTHESAKIYQFDAAVDLVSGTQAGTLIDYRFPSTLTEWAVFGDLTVNFNERFSLQLGGRGSRNEQHYSEVDSGPLVPLYYGQPSPLVTPSQQMTGSAYTYLLTPQWTLSKDTMIYARFTSGYRLGGNNVQAIVGQIPPQYDPDKTTNYEAGIKGRMFNGTLNYDAAVYYTDWKNIQISQISPITSSGYNDNAGTAKTQGLELSLQARPTQGLTIGATASLIDASLTEDFPANAATVGHEGDRLPYSPHVAGSLSLDQDFRLTSSWTAYIGGSVTYQGERLGEFASAFDSAGRFSLPAYTDVDLRAGVRSDSWTVNLFANNVTDERGVVGARINPYLLNNGVYYSQPRTVGVSIARAF